MSYPCAYKQPEADRGHRGEQRGEGPLGLRVGIEPALDGDALVITYGPPEMKARSRGNLRPELEWLGFGRLIPGVWVSPNPLGRIALNHLR